MDAQLKWALGAIGGALAVAMFSRANRQTKAYAITASDIQWLSRAVEHEGAPQGDVAKTLVNLFAYLWTRQGEKGASKDLGTLVQAYSSPVDPLWFPDGAKHIQYAAKLSGAALAAENAAASRRQDVYSVQTSFSPSTIAAVKAAVSDGAIWNEDWTDYAAPSVDASSRYIQRTTKTPGQNTFYTRVGGWPGYVVHGNILVRNA